MGGSGTIIGAFLGAVLIGTLDQSLARVPEISEFWRDAILGTLILLAVILDVTVTRHFRERGRRQNISSSTAEGAVAHG